jgi:hypothetical protein
MLTKYSVSRTVDETRQQRQRFENTLLLTSQMLYQEVLLSDETNPLPVFPILHGPRSPISLTTV